MGSQERYSVLRHGSKRYASPSYLKTEVDPCFATSSVTPVSSKIPVRVAQHDKVGGHVKGSLLTFFPRNVSKISNSTKKVNFLIIILSFLMVSVSEGVNMQMYPECKNNVKAGQWGSEGRAIVPGHGKNQSWPTWKGPESATRMHHVCHWEGGKNKIWQAGQSLQRNLIRNTSTVSQWGKSGIKTRSVIERTESNKSFPLLNGYSRF